MPWLRQHLPERLSHHRPPGMAPLGSFQYQPLETSTTIRLAAIPTLGSVSENELISIALFHAELSNFKGRYAALSYMWGDPAMVHTIRCNGTEMLVTKSVMNFLRRLIAMKDSASTESQGLIFWIDAICIDQKNDEEIINNIRVNFIYYNHTNMETRH